MEQTIVVIGSGAGGLPAATAIAEKGYQVILIERGPAVGPSQSKINQYNFETASLPWPTAESEWSGSHALQRALGLGGSTLRYQAVTHTLSVAVLEKWGLNVRSINKTIQTTKDFLKIAGHKTPHHALNSLSTRLLESAHRLGWKASAVEAAILSKPHEGRPACNKCGMCVFGCLPNDKTTTANSWLVRAKKTGRLKILTNTQVLKLNLKDSKTVESLDIIRNERPEKIKADAVVVSAGALETPFLLKNSKQTFAPDGIGNKNVGRYLADTRVQNHFVIGDKMIEDAHAGIPIDLVVKEFESEGILLYQGRNLGGIVGPVSLAKLYSVHEGPERTLTWMKNNYKRIGIIASMMESGGNRNDIVDTRKKRFSITTKERDSQNEVATKMLLKKWTKAAGFKSLWDEVTHHSSLSGAMLRGACRIGNNEKIHSVDPNGKLYGYNNIFVSDASILNQGLIAHPSFILQVLGYHIGQSLGATLRA